MRVPEYAMLGEKCLDRIFIGGIDVTFRRIMKRAALTDEEIHDVAKECEMDNELDRMLNYQEIMILKVNLQIIVNFLLTYKGTQR